MEDAPPLDAEPVGSFITEAKEPLGAVVETEEGTNSESNPRRGVGSRASLAHRQRSVVRALRLLEELVDETETRGTGGLRSHGARVRGAKMVLRLESKVRW